MRWTFLLTEPKREARVAWGRANRNTDWTTHIFTDESIFYTNYKGRVRVVRPPGKAAAYDPKYTRPHVHSGWTSIMVWGALAYGKKYPLVHVKKAIIEAYPELAGTKKITLTGERYADVILFERLSVYAAELAREGRQGIVVEDNAPTHNNQHTREVREQLGITRASHPASSPDLNPIENLWRELKKRIWRSGRRPRTEEELWQAILDAYDAMTQEELDALVMSMVSRPIEVIATRGYHTGH